MAEFIPGSDELAFGTTDDSGTNDHGRLLVGTDVVAAGVRVFHVEAHAERIVAVQALERLHAFMAGAE